MSAPAIQLTFTLRTSPNIRTVHLLGSWDGYKSQLPLSVVKDTGAKPGSWKGVFRFQGTHALKLGSRYWYYYIIDGYHVSHDPSKNSVTEQTTGRKLNILDVPSGKPAPSSAVTTPTTPTARSNKKDSHSSPNKASSRHSREIPKGRPLSPGRIVHPKPSKPYASRQLREADYELNPSMLAEIEEVAQAFGSIDLTPTATRYNPSPSDLSDVSSASGRSFSSSSSPSSLSSSPSTSPSTPASACSCERYGITRDGRRIKLDCGGTKCADSSGDDNNEEDSASDCSDSSSEEEESESEAEPEEVARRRVQQRGRAAPTKPPVRQSLASTKSATQSRHAPAPAKQSSTRHAAPAATTTRTTKSTTTSSGRHR